MGRGVGKNNAQPKGQALGSERELDAVRRQSTGGPRRGGKRRKRGGRGGSVPQHRLTIA